MSQSRSPTPKAPRLSGAIPIARLGVEARLDSQPWGSLPRCERWRGAIYTFEREYADVDLLVADRSAIASEALTHVIARAMGASAIPSYLVRIDREYLLDSKQWAEDQKHMIAFGVESAALRTTQSFDPALIGAWQGLAKACVLDTLLGINPADPADFAFDGHTLYLANNAGADCVRSAMLAPDDFPQMRGRPQLIDRMLDSWTIPARRAFAARLRSASLALELVDFDTVVLEARLPDLLNEHAARLVARLLESRARGVYSISLRSFWSCGSLANVQRRAVSKLFRTLLPNLRRPTRRRRRSACCRSRRNW